MSGWMVFTAEKAEKESSSSSSDPCLLTPGTVGHLRSYRFTCIIRVQYGTINIGEMKRTQGMRARALATLDIRRK